MHLDFGEDWRLRLHKEFDEPLASTQLPERSDYAWDNEFLQKREQKWLKALSHE